MNNIKTKSKFTLVGVISNIVSDSKMFGYSTGKTTKGKEYRKIRFLLQTSQNNKVAIELFGVEKDKAYLYNKSLRKTKEVNWNNRFTTKIEDYELITPEYDMCKNISDRYKDGDVVKINGELSFSEYVVNGIKKNQVRNHIRKMYTYDKEFDLNSEYFVEVNRFTQEIIINSNSFDHKENRYYIDVFTGDFFGVHNATFIIDANTSKQIFIDNILNLKYGDFITVFGVINNRVEKNSTDGSWGREVVTSYDKSLEIVGASGESLEPKRYTESELEPSGTLEADGNDRGLDFIDRE